MGMGDGSLDDLWAAAQVLGGGGGPTKIRGKLQSLVRTGVGSFFLTFTEALPIAEMMAFVQSLSGGPIPDLQIGLSDGDDTHQFVLVTVGGGASEISVCVAFWRSFIGA